MSQLQELYDARTLVWNLTLREVRGKYKRTALGQAWSLLNPLAQMLIFSTVFGLVLKAQPQAGSPSGLKIFALWLTTALLPWIFFVNVITGGMSSLVDNANLIKKVSFPRQALVISNALSWVVSFVVEMSVLVIAICVFGGRPYAYIPLAIVFMAVLACFGLGIGMLLSICNVYFRDTQHFIALLTQVWFYATPIVYPITIVSRSHPGLVPWLRANPIERFAAVFRNLLYDGRLPDLSDALVCIASAAIALLLGFWVFGRAEGRLAEEL